MLLHVMLQTSLSWPALIQPDNILIMTEASYSNAHLNKNTKHGAIWLGSRNIETLSKFSFGTFVQFAPRITSLTLQEVSPLDVWRHNDQQVGLDLQVGPEKECATTV